MREWYSLGIWAITFPISESGPPIVVPWPHIVSSTGVTVEVTESALVNACASRDVADSSVLWPTAPGLVKISTLDLDNANSKFETY